MKRSHGRANRRAVRAALGSPLLCTIVFLYSAALACGGDDSGPTAAPAPPEPIVVDTGALPGGRLAFAYHARDTRSRIYAMRPDGSELTALSPADHSAWEPAWSPDGSRLAYRAETDVADAGIWVVRADGSGLTNISTAGDSPFWIDDTRVGFGCPTGVCFANADGSGGGILLRRERPYGVSERDFRLSPDGTVLAFDRAQWLIADFGTTQIRLVRLDGTGERVLPTGTSGLYENRFPNWSPDGRRMAFAGNRYGIAVVDLASGVVQTVSRPGAVAFSGPAWSPDGRQIVFGTDAREFYIANSDGTGSIRRVRVAMPTAAADAVAQTGWSWTAR